MIRLLFPGLWLIRLWLRICGVLQIRAFSFGGGVQSMAALVLAAKGEIDYRTFLFANVGEDSEDPRTLAYFRDVARPYAEAHGLELIELHKERRDGTIETLVERIFSTKRSVPIPARLSNGAPGSRTCTSDFKISVISRWLKLNGATILNPAICGLGISVDEMHRARTDSGIAWQTLEYPLLDLRLRRRDCENIIRDAGLPMPPKSSCFFCPYHTRAAWIDLKRTRPDLFQKAVDIENHLNYKRQAFWGKDVIRLHSSMYPLEQAVGGQLALWKDDEMENCESGYCMV